MSSAVTKAQAFSECFGKRFEFDRCSCNSSTSSRSMVIIKRSSEVRPEDMQEFDWSAGTYEEILSKYDAESIDDYPPVHAVDLLSIATKSDPVPMKDVPEDLLDRYRGVYLGNSPFVKTLQDDKFCLMLTE